MSEEWNSAEVATFKNKDNVNGLYSYPRSKADGPYNDAMRMSHVDCFWTAVWLVSHQRTVVFFLSAADREEWNGSEEAA